MSVTVQAISGPDDAAYIYLKGSHTAAGFERVNSIRRAWVAADPSRLAAARDELVAQLEQS